MNLATVCVLLCIVSAGGILCQDDRNYNISPDMIKFLPLLGLDGSTVELVKMLGSFLQFFDFKTANVSEDCAKSMKIVFASARDVLNSPNSTGIWAIKMLDASAKLPSGILEGGLLMFGSFDECLSISSDPSLWAGTHNYSNAIKGQYCSIKLGVPPPNSTSDTQGELRTGGAGGGSSGMLIGAATTFLRIDVCFPTACSVPDIDIALKHIKTESLGLSFTTSMCQKDEPIKLKGAQIAAIVVFSLLGLFLLAGTALDVGLNLLNHFYRDGIVDAYTGKTWVTALTSFSMYKNAVKLLDTRSSSDSLSAVNGIRFLSMTWVILGHAYMFVIPSITGNLFSMMDMIKNFAMQAIFNGYLAVDSFFFLGGLLLAYVTIREFHKGDRLNCKFFFLFYFHRYWRLTPAILFTILIVFLWPLTGSGPGWESSTVYPYNACVDNWWINLLYLQNLVKVPDMCVGHSWYLATDMQFYVISPIILVSLYLNRNVGLAVNTLFLLVTTITSGVLAHVRSFPPTVLLSDLTNQQEFMVDFYFKPWCRMGPFCIGIYLGYFLALRRDYKVPRPLLVLGWCLAIAVNMWVLYAVYPWNSGHLPTRGVADLYSSMHRTAWAVGLAWMTFACATGHGGIVNRILSWAPFGPLGRMSYMAYLLHPYIQYSYASMLRERLIYTHYLYVTLYLGFVVISYGAAFVASLAFEAPFLALEKILFRRPSSDQKRNTGIINANTDNENDDDVALHNGEK